MDFLFELAGGWLARAYAFYGMVFLAIPTFLFANLVLLGAVVWAAASHARGRQPWPWVPGSVRRWLRLAVEVSFGLINPLLYLAILVPSLPGFSFPGLRSDGWWWLALTVAAWTLLVAFWTVRLFGAALDPGSAPVRAGVRALLLASIGCVLVYAAKDVWLLSRHETVALIVLRLCPLYLIPVVLMWDYLRTNSRQAFFLLPDRAARFAVAGVLAVALATVALAAHRRSDAAVRKLVSDHRESIRAAAARYDVDPRLVASIVYVTHRDQLSPFRGALERLLINAWARNLRGDLGIRSPDKIDEIGTDENPLLNRALDISVGLAQIKPRTAQTASVLATGIRPDELPKPAFYGYRDVEPLGDGWAMPSGARISVVTPIPVPAERQVVANGLLDARSNLETCALILALYQNQWEATNRDWSLRGRPEILATLYQIGFARSKPHGAPRSNAFGDRVRQVYQQPWLGELLHMAPRSQS